MSTLPTIPSDDKDSVPQSPFEQIKRTDPDGNEFWSARDLMPLLDYSKWQNLEQVFDDVYSSLCLEDRDQTEMTHALKFVRLGAGASRGVDNWHLSRKAFDRALSRIASQKPEVARMLGRNISPFRIEVDLGAILLDFCHYAGLSLDFQYAIEDYRFDFCVEKDPHRD